MTNPLANILQGGNYNPQGGMAVNPQLGPNFNPQGANYNPQTNTQTLPNGGGSYNPAGNSTIFPAAPVVPTAPTSPTGFVPVPGVNYDKYRDPKTGRIMSPQEYAIYLGNKVPKGTGEIPNYAMNAVTDPNKTSNELIGQAERLNNSRNDIATGTTDPYGVGNKSGIAYSPAELKAIESAYAGIYDPALSDVFSRLRDKQAEEDKAAELETIVFKTNEAIRQWQATTGTKSSGGDGTTSGNYKFTNTQLNSGASNAGMHIDTFKALNPELQNFYINPPIVKGSQGTQVPLYINFEEDIKNIIAGDVEDEDGNLITSESVAEEIRNSTKISPEVKTYFLNRLPDMTEEEKKWYMEGFWGKLFNYDGARNR